MDRKQRLLCAMRGEPVDRIPVSFWRHFTPQEQREDDYIQAHLEFYQNTRLDFVKIMHDGLTAPFDLEITHISDLKKIRSTGMQNTYLQRMAARAAGVTEKLKGEVYTIANLFAPFMLLRKIGDERLHAYLQEDETAVRSALDAISEDLCVLVERLLTACGCLGVFVCFQGAEHKRFTPEAFRRIERPADVRVLECANKLSNYNIAHFCAWDEEPNNLGLWQDYPASTVNWAIYADQLPLVQGKKFFGNRPVLGGFDNRRAGMLYTAPREQIELETRRIVDAYKNTFGSTNGLIVGADCSFLTDFELQRFGWVAQELERVAAQQP